MLHEVAPPGLNRARIVPLARLITMGMIDIAVAA
jgi:hypothetical protein